MAVINSNLLREFVDLQSRLLSAFFKDYPDRSNFMSEVPAEGSLLLDGRIWRFSKHGMGVAFQSAESSLVVDVHRVYDDVSDAVDAWRMLQFAESKGVSAITEHSVDDDLMKLERSGLLRRTRHAGVYMPTAGRR